LSQHCLDPASDCCSLRRTHATDPNLPAGLLQSRPTPSAGF